jgi:hypothetical protein
MTVERLLTHVRKNNVWNSYFKEMVGSELPHLVMVMNRYEALDQGFQLVTNGNFFLLFANWLSQQLQKLQNRLNPGVLTGIVNEADNQVLWLRLAKALFIFAHGIGFALGAQGIRNAVMIHITKTTRFVDMVGLNGKKEDPLPVRQAAIKKNIQQFFTRYFLGLGTAGLLASLCQLAAIRSKAVPQLFKWFHQHLGLPGGNYSKLTTLASVFLWAYPVYLGHYLFARDEAEKKEILVKAAGFAFAFAIIPQTVERAINKAFKDKQFPVLGSGKNLALLGELVTGCVAYTAIPTFTNLVMRKDRAKRLGLLDKNALSTSTSNTPHINYKTSELVKPLPSQDPFASFIA